MEKTDVTCLRGMVKLLNKFGLSRCMVDFKAVIGLCKCMVMLLNKLGLCGALCMVMLLYKVGLCIARCLEMMLYVALRLEMEELFTIRLCMALRLVIYLDMNDFMVALLNYMVFLVTDVFMVVLQKFLNYMVFIVTDVFMGKNL